MLKRGPLVLSRQDSGIGEDGDFLDVVPGSQFLDYQVNLFVHKRLAADHPVRFDLLDPRGQLVRSLTRTQSTDGFYAFDVATAPDAPTGNYNGRVSIGGASFEKSVVVSGQRSKPASSRTFLLPAKVYASPLCRKPSS